MRRLLGSDEADALVAALDRAPERGLRVQHDRITAERLTGLVGWRLEPVPWAPHGFTLDAGGDAPGAHALHEAGAFYLQDPSAMAPAAALAVRPGEHVIDLAAAPGGKATALVADLAAGGREHEGVLVANDVHPRRVAELARNLERVGARNVVITQRSPAQWARIAPGAFDAVLLDAPCSGEGMFRKSDEARAAWSERTVEACALRQADLLAAAAALLAPGGRLVYATCTFAPEENEAVIGALLQRRPDLRPWPVLLPGSDAGADDAGAAAVARLWPHRVRGDGHALARLVRDVGSGDEPAPGVSRSERRQAGAPVAPDRAILDAWRTFAEATLSRAGREALVARADEGRLRMQGGLLWRRAGPEAWALHGSLRPGLALGRLRGSRFLPAHALGQALRPGEARIRLDLPIDGPWPTAWMAGEELTWSEVRAAGGRAFGPDADGWHELRDEQVGDGWLQIAVAGCGLGWSRRSGDRLRNVYPKGLRRRA